MEDLKIIFYLLVAVAWLILKNYKKVRRNKPEISEMETPVEPTPPMEETNTGPGRLKPLAVSKAARVVPTARKRRPGPVDDVGQYEFDAINEEAKPVTKFFKEQRKAEAEALTNPEFQPIPDVQVHAGNFDLRTAVIYAEILKRPEY